MDGCLWTEAPVEQTEMGGMGKETPLYEQDSAHGTTFIQSQQLNQESTETIHLPELAFNIKSKENTLKIHDFLEQCVLMIITQLHTSDDTSLKISLSFRFIEATETHMQEKNK